MRLVLDTNTALSGLLWGGTPGRLIDAAEASQVELASSAARLAELQGVLSREKFAKPLARRGLWALGQRCLRRLCRDGQPRGAGRHRAHHHARSGR